MVLSRYQSDVRPLPFPVVRVITGVVPSTGVILKATWAWTRRKISQSPQSQWKFKYFVNNQWNSFGLMRKVSPDCYHTTKLLIRAITTVPLEVTDDSSRNTFSRFTAELLNSTKGHNGQQPCRKDNHGEITRKRKWDSTIMHVLRKTITAQPVTNFGESSQIFYSNSLHRQT